VDALKRFKETVLKDYPRLKGDDTFNFQCNSGLPCFNQCCRDVNIFLTPYDILRMKQALKITSTEFLERYTLLPVDRNQQYPVVLLAMEEEDEHPCHFVTQQGCDIYSDRPWACRMYPIGLASPKEDAPEEEFCFLMQEDICKGVEQPKEWTLRDWMSNQGIDRYNEFGEAFKEIVLHDWFQQGKQLTSKQMEMFHMVCYDIDRYRRFLYDSTFFDRFIVDETLVEKMRTDDELLLFFGFKWLRFCLFKEPTIEVREDAVPESS